MKPMWICVLITMGRLVVKENGKQLKRDDSYSLWKQVLGFSFNCYHLPNLNQYSQPQESINKIREWKPPWMNVQTQARKLFQYIMVHLAALLQVPWLAWVRPEQPFPLQLWAQEGDFISPEQKTQGGSGFGDHASKGQGAPSHTFSQSGDEQTTVEKGEVLKNCVGERDCWDNDLKSRRKCPPCTESTWSDLWPGAETTGRAGGTFHTGAWGIAASSDPFVGAVLHPGSVALAHS